MYQGSTHASCYVTNSGSMRAHRTNAALSCRVGVALLLLAAAGTSSLTAQTLQGRLLERGSDRPVELGLLILYTSTGDSITSSLSNQEGFFSLSSPDPGEFMLLGSALGYEETRVGVFELGEGGELSVDFRLPPAPIRLGGITVEASSDLLREPALIANGFVRRAQRGQGYFITPGQIRRGGTSNTQQLLQTVPRVIVNAGSAGPRATPVQMLGTMGYCTPRIYVDGMPAYLAPGLAIDNVAPINDLEAVEVYRTANEAPIEYSINNNSGCGIILFWTHRR